MLKGSFIIWFFLAREGRGCPWARRLDKVDLKFHVVVDLLKERVVQFHAQVRRPDQGFSDERGIDPETELWVVAHPTEDQKAEHISANGLSKG